MEKGGKFYKCTFVPLLSLLLCFCFVGKSVEAATYVNQDYPIEGYQTYTGSIRTHNVQVLPENVTQIYDSTEEVPTTRAIASYRFGLDQMFKVPASAQSAQGYSAGYLNGVFRYELQCSMVNNVPNMQYVRMNIESGLTQNDSLQVVCYQYYASGGIYYFRFAVVMNNYSVENTAQDRFINMGNIIVNLQFMMNNTVEAPQITLTPVIVLSSNNPLQFSPVATPGQSIAGQLYAAIENSTQIEDIVTYLSLIEDASGDINVAISHIDSTLIPSVIQYLQDIRQNTTYTYLRLDQIITYLRVISDTWPQYSAQVLFYLQQLVEMNTEQSSIAAEVESQYAAKASEGAKLNQGMQVVIPSVNQADFDINANVDTGTVTTLSAFWAMFPNNALIGTLFAIAIAGIAAGFFLYGKKG